MESLFRLLAVAVRVGYKTAFSILHKYQENIYEYLITIL